MKCVSCSSPLITLEAGGLEIDYCPQCHGIWLDSGELELLTNSAVGKNFVEGGLSADKSAARKCPICRKLMKVVFLGGEERVELDLCGFGHGIWFDRGELKTVLKAIDGKFRDTISAELRAILDDPAKTIG